MAQIGMFNVATGGRNKSIVRVSGSGGGETINGKYKKNGTQNGKPKYTKVGSSVNLTFEGVGTGWAIGQGPVGYYYTTSDNLNSSNWLTNDGTPPAPKVRYG